MKPVYYTTLNRINLTLDYLIKTEGTPDFEVKVPIAAKLIAQERLETDILQTTVYDAVKEKLGHDQFFLVPSSHEIELQSYLADQIAHPEKYPNNGESIGWLHYDYDT